MPIRKFVKVYQTLLRDHPLLIQSLQTGTLSATGDLMAQTVIERRAITEIKPKRTAQFFMLGTCLVGPVCASWYRVLSKTFGDSGKSTVVKKVACDQLLFAPCFVVVFMSCLNFLQGKSFQHLKQELDAKYADILIANYKLWPAVQVVNFYLVPVNYQVLLVQIVALSWNSYLSWKTQQKVYP